jgi:hypothetical protein
MKSRLRIALRLGGALIILGTTFLLGYWVGIKDKGPQHRALLTVRRAPGNPNSSGQGFTWYDISKPWEAAKLRSDEKRLVDQGVEHYVTEGVLEWTLRPNPDPRRVNSHR